MDHASLLWAALRVLTKPRHRELLRAYGNLSEAAAHLDEALLLALGCAPEVVARALACSRAFDPCAEERELTARGIGIVALGDPSYPPALAEIHDPPIFLYHRGDLAVLERPLLGMVGTRKMSKLGKMAVDRFVPPIVRAGIVTVSGLASGIDWQVARCTLDEGGRTVAVLGHGFALLSPQNKVRLAEEILAAGGLLLTEYPLRVRGERYTFPHRNRIIAGLSRGTLVLEAPEKSGALLTAKQSLDEGRDVFVVPGSIFDKQYVGSNRFLSSGMAKLVSWPRQVLEELGFAATAGEASPAYEPRDEAGRKVYDALSSLPQSGDDLVQRTALDAAAVGCALTVMELDGAVKDVGGAWVRA